MPPAPIAQIGQIATTSTGYELTAMASDGNYLYGTMFNNTDNCYVFAKFTTNDLMLNKEVETQSIPGLGSFNGGNGGEAYDMVYSGGNLYGLITGGCPCEVNPSFTSASYISQTQMMLGGTGVFGALDFQIYNGYMYVVGYTATSPTYYLTIWKISLSPFSLVSTDQTTEQVYEWSTFLLTIAGGNLYIYTWQNWNNEGVIYEYSSSLAYENTVTYSATNMMYGLATDGANIIGWDGGNLLYTTTALTALTQYTYMPGASTDFNLQNLCYVDGYFFLCDESSASGAYIIIVNPSSPASPLDSFSLQGMYLTNTVVTDGNNLYIQDSNGILTEVSLDAPPSGGGPTPAPTPTQPTPTPKTTSTPTSGTTNPIQQLGGQLWNIIKQVWNTATSAWRKLPTLLQDLMTAFLVLMILLLFAAAANRRDNKNKRTSRPRIRIVTEKINTLLNSNSVKALLFF